MSVENVSAATDYDGATGGVPLACQFKADDASQVFLATFDTIGGTEFVNVDPANYTVTPLGDGEFTVTPTLTYPITTTVRCYRWIDYTQPFDFGENGELPAERVSAMGDRLEWQIQQVRLELGLDVAAITLPPGAALMYPTTTFANSTARGNATPAFLGQLGVQLNTGAVYRGTSLAAGGWTIIPTGGSGDVTGPASAGKNTVAFFGDTTGKVLTDFLGTNPDTTPFVQLGEITNGTARPLYVEQAWNYPTLAGRLFILNAEIASSAAHATLQEWQVSGANRGKFTIDGQLWMLDGSVTYPTYSFGSETGTGMYRHSGGTLRFAVAGAEYLRLGAGEVRAMTYFACEIGTVTKFTVGTTNSVLSTNLLPGTDASYNLGASSARMLNGWFSGTVTAPAVSSISVGRQVFEGTSIEFGYGLSAGQRWPDVLVTLPSFVNKGASSNFATNAATIAIAAARYVASVYPLRPTAGEEVNLFTGTLGTNDVNNGVVGGGATAAAALQAYCVQARSDGFKVRVCTIMDRIDFTTITRRESQIFNALIKEGYGVWHDGVIDIAELLPDYTNTVRFQDGIHPAVSGAAAIAELANWLCSTSSSPALMGAEAKNAGSFNATDRLTVAIKTTLGIFAVGGVPDTALGNIYLRPEDTALTDYAGITLYPRPVSYAGGSRAWQIGANFVTTGGLDFAVSSGPASAPNATLVASFLPGGAFQMAGPIISIPQALSGAGAVNITTGSTHFTSTGAAQALTLANGTAGQIKRIVHVVDGGSGVLTPTSKIGYTTITFTNAGDAVTLEYTAAGWSIVGIFGAVAA